MGLGRRLRELDLGSETGSRNAFSKRCKHAFWGRRSQTNRNSSKCVFQALKNASFCPGNQIPFSGRLRAICKAHENMWSLDAMRRNKPALEQFSRNEPGTRLWPCPDPGTAPKEERTWNPLRNPLRNLSSGTTSDVSCCRGRPKSGNHHPGSGRPMGFAHL